MYIFPTSLFFSFLTVLLSAAALTPASDHPNPNHPFPTQHVKRELALPPNLSDITNPSSSQNTTNALQPHCYPPDPTQPPILPTDCYTALYTLLAYPDAMVLRHWDRSSDLPVEHAYRTCSIILARTSATADDIFQQVLVAHAAALLVQSCVTARWGYQGGTARIGLRREFVVYLSASGVGEGVGLGSATA